MLKIYKYQWIYVTIGLLLVLMLSSCGGSKSKTEFVESALGVWQTGCQNFGLNNEYGLVTLEVGEQEFSFTNTFYEDPQCSRPTVKFISGGSLTKHNNLVRDDNQFLAQIDYLVEQVSAELLSDAKKTQFNANATCEIVDWEVGVNVDVSNCVDISDSNVPRSEFDVYTTATMANAAGTSTDVLFAGMVRGTSADTRPTAPDFQNPYWRIEAVLPNP